MKKGKILGPDGLTIEFYLGFYDLLKNDILKVMQEAKSSGKVLGGLNSTFLDLNSNKQEYFEYFCPILYCNVFYKTISKILDNRLRPILSDLVSEEQFIFLFRRQIYDIMSIEQEALHSINYAYFPNVVVKLDLSKFYNKVSWTYLWLILIQIGMSFNGVN